MHEDTKRSIAIGLIYLGKTVGLVLLGFLLIIGAILWKWN